MNHNASVLKDDEFPITGREQLKQGASFIADHLTVTEFAARTEAHISTILSPTMNICTMCKQASFYILGCMHYCLLLYVVAVSFVFLLWCCARLRIINGHCLAALAH